MSRNLDRLARLERTIIAPEPFTIVWRIVEADTSIREPTRFKTVDGSRVWERLPDESAGDFEKRVLDEAGRLRA